jgi:hypothetical protein
MKVNDLIKKLSNIPDKEDCEILLSSDEEGNIFYDLIDVMFLEDMITKKDNKKIYVLYPMGRDITDEKLEFNNPITK